MYVQRSLIQESMLYKFKLSHNVSEATENICYEKCEGGGYPSALTRRFDKFCKGCNNFDDQVRSSKPKSVDFEAVLKAMEANSASKQPESFRRIQHSNIFVTFTTMVK